MCTLYVSITLSLSLCPLGATHLPLFLYFPSPNLFRILFPHLPCTLCTQQDIAAHTRYLKQPIPFLLTLWQGKLPTTYTSETLGAWWQPYIRWWASYPVSPKEVSTCSSPNIYSAHELSSPMTASQCVSISMHTCCCDGALNLQWDAELGVLFICNATSPRVGRLCNL